MTAHLPDTGVLQHLKTCLIPFDFSKIKAHILKACGSGPEALQWLQLPGFSGRSCFAYAPCCSAAASPVRHGLGIPAYTTKAFAATSLHSHDSRSWPQWEQHCVSESDNKTKPFRPSRGEGHKLNRHKGFGFSELCAIQTDFLHKRAAPARVHNVFAVLWLEYTC